VVVVVVVGVGGVPCSRIIVSEYSDKAVEERGACRRCESRPWTITG
jgi:hypothetical protein